MDYDPDLSISTTFLEQHLLKTPDTSIISENPENNPQNENHEYKILSYDEFCDDHSRIAYLKQITYYY